MTTRARTGGISEDHQLMFLGDVDTSGGAITDGQLLVWNEEREKFIPSSTAPTIDWSQNTHDEDLRFPATAINPPGAASDPTRNTTDGSLEFSATATNVISFFVQIPHNWVIGTDLRFHVHWQPTSTNVGNVLWRFTYEIANIGDNFAAPVVATVLDASTGSATQHLMTDQIRMTMTDITPSAMLKCLVERVGNDGTDTYADAAKLLEVDIHYTCYGNGYTFSD